MRVAVFTKYMTLLQGETLAERFHRPWSLKHTCRSSCQGMPLQALQFRIAFEGPLRPDDHCSCLAGVCREAQGIDRGAAEEEGLPALMGWE